MEKIISLVISYKYFILFPIACVEGPIFSLLIGYLVCIGYLDFIPSYAILILGDLIPDITYYYIGRYGNKKRLIEKYGRRFNFLNRNFKFVEKFWNEHGGKTMFLSKLAYGLSTPFLISAGLVNMPLKKFISYAFPVTIFQYAVFLTAGYYLGQSYKLASLYIKDAGIIFAVILVLFIIGYAVMAKSARQAIIKIEKEEEEEQLKQQL
jgi:membrane protein DedA with SNARE-associated domain